MKNTKSSKKLITKYTADLGVAIMALATVVGMLELPDHTVNTHFILPAQTVRVGSSNINDLNNPIRREKEESNTEYVSYSESERTPSRSGKY